MARQKGIFYLQGTLNEITYYKMNGVWLARKKSSLTGLRVNTSPAFANSRKSNDVFAVAAAIAAQVYKGLPKAKRKHGLIGKLTGRANELLHERKSNEEVMAALKEIAGAIY